MYRLILPLCLILLAVLSAHAQPAATTNTAPSLPPQKPSPVPTSNNANVITPAEWQELNAARQQAMKANPALMAKAMALSKQMRDFMGRLNTAILQTDPKLAPLVARLQGHGPGGGPGMMQPMRPGQPPPPGQSPQPMQPPPPKPQ